MATMPSIVASSVVDRLCVEIKSDSTNSNESHDNNNNNNNNNKRLMNLNTLKEKQAHVFVDLL
jgi:hypothetical protein